MEPVLAKFAAGHLYTALAAVCWDLIEPEEGKFDFSLVDGAIKSARRHMVWQLEERRVHLPAALGENRFETFSARPRQE